MDLWSGETVNQDHAAGQESAEDQAFGHGPPLPLFFSSHCPKAKTTFKNKVHHVHHHHYNHQHHLSSIC